MGKLFTLFIIFNLLTACSFKPSFRDLSGNDSGSDNIKNPITPPITDIKKKNPRTSPDFINGQIYKTTSGAEFIGSFGEIASKQTLSNGVSIEGAFYAE